MLYIVRELPHTFEHLVNRLQDSRFTMCVRIHRTCSIGDEIHIVLKNTRTNVCVCVCMTVWGGGINFFLFLGALNSAFNKTKI